MDKKSKVLVAFVILLIFVTVGYTYYKTMILNEFEIIETEEEVFEEEVEELPAEDSFENSGEIELDGEEHTLE